MKPKNARPYLLEDFHKSNYFIDLFSLLFPESLLILVFREIQKCNIGVKFKTNMTSNTKNKVT